MSSLSLAPTQSGQFDDQYMKIGGSPRYLKSEIDEVLKQVALGRKKTGKAKQVKARTS